MIEIILIKTHCIELTPVMLAMAFNTAFLFNLFRRMIAPF